MNPTETLTHALPRFLRRCDAKSTRTAYKRELQRFLDWLPATPTDETLFDYRDHLRDRGLSPTTVRWQIVRDVQMTDWTETTTNLLTIAPSPSVITKSGIMRSLRSPPQSWLFPPQQRPPAAPYQYSENTSSQGHQ